jgi:hypothetical protein
MLSVLSRLRGFLAAWRKSLGRGSDGWVVSVLTPNEMNPEDTTLVIALVEAFVVEGLAEAKFSARDYENYVRQGTIKLLHGDPLCSFERIKRWLTGSRLKPGEPTEFQALGRRGERHVVAEVAGNQVVMWLKKEI